MHAVGRDPFASAFIYGLGIAVGIAWFASTVADIASSSYATPTAMHGLLGVIVGAVYGEYSRRRGRKDIDKEKDE